MLQQSLKDFGQKIHLCLHLGFIFRCKRIFEASKILGQRLQRFLGKFKNIFGMFLNKKIKKVLYIGVLGWITPGLAYYVAKFIRLKPGLAHIQGLTSTWKTSDATMTTTERHPISLNTILNIMETQEPSFSLLPEQVRNRSKTEPEPIVEEGQEDPHNLDWRSNFKKKILLG